MANPRKFSEKIALQKQKQAEGTAEFEKIMNEVKATRVVDNILGNTDITDGNGLHRNASLSGGSGGSGTSSGASGGGASPDANAGGGGGIGGGGGGGGGGGVGIVNTTTGSPTYRESRGRSVGVGPMRRPSERKQDRSPYGSTASGLMLSGMTQQTQNSYLSPPMDSSWRRSNSDSALHQTLNNLAEGNFGASSPAPSVMGDLNSLHANYHHHHHPHHSQRSQSPNIGRSYSPQAQRRKNTLLQQQQQQQQLHHQQQQLQHQRLQMQQQQQQQQAQQQQHQQLQQHLQNQQQSLQQQQQQQQQHLHHQQQQQQYANAKYNNSNIMFKSLHEQQLAFNNTGSLPDLTSVHYSTPNPTNNSNTQMMQTTTTTQQQQQQTLSPILSPHHNNGCHDRDQSPSPFSPSSTAGGGNSVGGPPSPYHQQQNSPTSATNTPTANVQTSPHLSFTNLSVQSPVNVQQTTAQNTAAAFSTLPTLGAASSTGNLTDYRQPLNPPSPGSSPGLLTSGPANDIHTSAPPSPIRHCQSNLNTPVSVGNSTQNQQAQMPTQSLQNTFGTLDSNTGYNTLNPAFHNHFEQFHLGDNSQSPQNNYDALEFEDLGMGNQQHNNFNSKIIDFGDLTTPSSATSSNTTRTNSTNTTTNCNNNNNLPQQQQQQQQQRNNSQQFQHHQQQQQLLNNNSTTSTTSSNTNSNGPSNTCRTHNTGLMNNNDRQQDILSANSSPIPSPLSHCVPPPSSPLPIPMSAHSPSHHQQQQQQQQLSLSVQTSPHHSPMHSPHHSPSPLSVSSPGLTMLGGSVSPVPSPSAHIIQHQQQQQQQQHQQHQHNHINNQTANQLHHNQTSHNNHHHHHHQQQQNQTHTPTTATNIPQIIFSDYSSSRDIFDSLDLDLGTIDGQGLQMLSDQNPIMIADSSVEDSFRRDLN
ncbi:myb-like protein I [Calliphora vicina]|uniref:myb-like protein I n=1 Tax=Calliphora vicina TaxID=7373 RepID=UPI00325BAC3C